MRSLAKEEIRNQPLSGRADLSIPTGSESPRLPRDYLIGQLGAEDGKAAPYREAAAILEELASGKTAGRRFTKNGEAGLSEIVERLSSLGSAASVRIGSPVPEGDGGVSYLIRFVGKDASLSGELRLEPSENGSWLVDFIALDFDEAAVGASGFDPLSYKRFL